VALSADGNTAIVGGPADNDNNGAAWVYTRSGGVWTQQGSKLIGTGAVAGSYMAQGLSVALSADGNTAIVGGPADNDNNGAAWVYTRSGGVWTQQGGKLSGTDATQTAGQGNSVALSGDGGTAILGGPSDNGGFPGGAGAAWVFTATRTITEHPILLVSSNTQVFQYDGSTGAPLGSFASGGGIGLAQTMVIGPDGNLYVATSGPSVVRYNGNTGQSMPSPGNSGAVFATGGGLTLSYGLAFGPDGNLYVGD